MTLDRLEIHCQYCAVYANTKNLKIKEFVFISEEAAIATGALKVDTIHINNKKGSIYMQHLTWNTWANFT